MELLTVQFRSRIALIALVAAAGQVVAGPPVLQPASLDGPLAWGGDGYASSGDRSTDVMFSDTWSALEPPSALRDVCARVWLDVSCRGPGLDGGDSGGGVPAAAPAASVADASAIPCFNRSCRGRLERAYLYCNPDPWPGDDYADLIDAFADAESVSGRLLCRVSGVTAGPPIDVHLEWAALTRVGSDGDR